MRAFRDMSIRRKLTWLPLLAVGVALLLASTAFLFHEWQAARAQSADRLDTLGQVIGANTMPALVFDDPDAARANLQTLSAESEVVSACLYDADRHLFAGYERAASGGRRAARPCPETIATVPGAWVGDGDVTLALPISALDGEVVGSVAIRADGAGVYTRLCRYLAIVGIVFLAASAAAALMASGLQKAISLPILELVSTARRVSSESDYSLRAESHSRDELGLLMDSFNEMLEQIQRRDRELERHRDHLDEEVKRRTRALEAAVEDLQTEIEQREKAEARIRELAYYDSLTGLPNRQLLKDRLELALEHARNGAEALGLLFLDLDRFKEINDSLGHAAGDRLLEQVAERLVGCVRGADHVSRPEGDALSELEPPPSTVSRQGGDEFTVLLTSLRSQTDATRVCQRILQAMNEPFLLGDREVVIGASIGVAVFPDDGRDAETLIKHADTAMYHAKASGRNDYQYFSESMKAAAIERITIEGDLRKALEREEFVLVYQPLVGVSSGRVEAVEALLRWRHPERGLVSPDKFVPVAEDCGLIVPIGEWVLAEACRQCKQWQDEEPGLEELVVGVNVSSRQLRKAQVIEATRRALRASGLAPDSLVLEMTESSMLHDDDEAVRVLQRLKESGVKIALDDFGTGFSSLSYLRRLPLDSLKIDMSFVDGLDSDTDSDRIVAAVIAMGHGLGLRIVAEGVERETQLDLLAARGCDLAQGFLFSPPLPPEALPGLLEEKEEERG